MDSKFEFSRELFIAFVGRQVKAVEASVATRERSFFSHLFDAELLQAVAACNMTNATGLFTISQNLYSIPTNLQSTSNCNLFTTYHDDDNEGEENLIFRNL